MAVFDITVMNYADLDFVRTELVSTIRSFGMSSVAEILTNLQRGDPVVRISTDPAAAVAGPHHDRPATYAVLVGSIRSLRTLGAQLTVGYRASANQPASTIRYADLNQHILEDLLHRA